MNKVVIAFCLSLLTAAPSFAQQGTAPAPPVIVTSGEGVVKRAPDRAWVTIAAESRARTAQEAQKATTDAMTAVLDKIKAAGIPADAIQTTGYNLQPSSTTRADGRRCAATSRATRCRCGWIRWPRPGM